MAESKAAKKNRKRGQKKLISSSDGKSAGFEVEEDISTHVPQVASAVKPAPPPLDPISDLKRQIDQAKAEKNHVKAQELRQKMWVLQDTVTLGRAGPGAPNIDIHEVVSSMVQATTPERTTTGSSSISSKNPAEKKLDKLKKKLQKIESLKSRRDSGESLEENQVAKIEGESEILEEISILEELLSEF